MDQSKRDAGRDRLTFIPIGNSLWSNNMSVCLSVRPVVRRPFSIFVFVFNSLNTREMITITITSVGVKRRNGFSPHWGPEDPSWVQSSLGVHMSLCLSVSPSVYLSVCLSVYLSVWSSMLIFGDQSVRPVIVCRACGRRPRGQIP